MNPHNKDQWLDGAGDAYYRRNAQDMGKGVDLVWPLIERLNLRDGKVLEIGCADGWRLEKLAKERGFEVAGIDPSEEAMQVALERRLPGPGFVTGTADDIEFSSGAFSLVILGFCMWFVEPELWFKVVTETDRVLADKGFLIIHDFVAARPMKVSNTVLEGPAWLYEFPKLWLGHPWYRVVLEHVGVRGLGKWMNSECATALYKDAGSIYGTEIYARKVDLHRNIA